MVRWGMRFLRARQPGELIPGLGRGFPWTSAAFFDLWDRLVLPWGTGLDLSWSPVLRFGWSSGDGKKRWGFFENTKCCLLPRLNPDQTPHHQPHFADAEEQVSHFDDGSRYEVDATIGSARNLKTVNRRNGNLKPYAVLWVDSGSKASTRIDLDNDESPSWDEKVLVPLPLASRLEYAVLYLEVVHTNTAQGSSRSWGPRGSRCGTSSTPPVSGARRRGA
ncbi:hypothetical protein ACQ4PT_048722 [Festuca glaucescens]